MTQQLVRGFSIAIEAGTVLSRPELQNRRAARSKCRDAMLILCLLSALVCAPQVRADDTPVQAYFTWSYSGSNGQQYATPEAAFTAYVTYCAEIHCAGTPSNLHPCYGYQDIYNGSQVNYCMQWNDPPDPPVLDAVFAGPTLNCWSSKQGVHQEPISSSPTTSVVNIYCTGGSNTPHDPAPPCPYCPASKEPTIAHRLGHPIEPESQTEIESEMDFDGPGLLKFGRTYTSSSLEWQSELFVGAYNLTLNSFANLPTNPSPAIYTDIVNLSDGTTRMASAPYMSNADLGRTGAPDVVVFRADGRTVGFPVSGGMSMSLATHETAKILTNQGVYSGVIIYGEDGLLENYDALGRLLSRGEVNGHHLTLTYLDSSGDISPSGAPACVRVSTGEGTVGRPSCVTDSITGRQIAFSFDANSNLQDVYEPSGNSIQYFINGPSAIGVGTVAGGYQLTSVTYQDGNTETFYYNQPAYTSGSTTLYRSLTGIVDENGNPYLDVGYDTNGNAISTNLAGGALSYTANGNQWTDPLGAVRTYYTTILTLAASDNSAASTVKLSGAVSQPAGSGSNGALSSITYDTFGNPTLVTDFNGNSTQYTYNSRNLEATRVEGYGTAVARTITSVWHPNYRLRIQMAEPLKMTYWVYNGQPDPTNDNAVLTCGPSGTLIDGNPVTVLCKRVEEDTLDTTGSTGLSPKLPNPLVTRTWSWTYNQNGQVLTAKDPLGNVTTTTYYASTDTSHSPAWYAAGDVNAVTDTLGHVTSFNQYDLNGRLLQMTDPNGVVTTLTYKPRGWLASRTVTQPSGGAETTTYTYDNVGQLTQVTLPDSTVLKYAYDPAHRLTTVTDSVGDTINYTLDGLGNRVGEQVKDPSSNLTRNIARVYDQLSRLQTVTGALQ